MKFPVQRRQSQKGLEAPRGHCPTCQGPLQGEPGTFAFVNGGALRQLADGAAMPAPDLRGFLSLGMHGAHSEGGSSPSAMVSVVEEAPIGQFEFYFCSTQCLRGFFNNCVDELERRLEQHPG